MYRQSARIDDLGDKIDAGGIVTRRPAWWPSHARRRFELCSCPPRPSPCIMLRVWFSLSTYASATVHSATSCSRLFCSTIHPWTTDLRFSRVFLWTVGSLSNSYSVFRYATLLENAMFTCLLAWRELCFLTSSFHVLASRTAYSPTPRCPNTRGPSANQLDSLYTAALAGPGGGE